MEPDADVRDIEDQAVAEPFAGADLEILPEVVTEAAAPPQARRVARPRDGISLHRFLDRAKPCLAEASALAALVLDAVAAMHDSGCGHGGLDSRSVRILPDGSVRLADWGSDSDVPVGLDDEVKRADIKAAAAIVEEIARSAGRPARPLTETEDRMAARLKSGSDPASLRRRGTLKAARGLELAIGRVERRDAARQGLAELARAVTAPIPDADRQAGSSAMAGRRPPSVGVRTERKLPPPARRRPISPSIWKPLAGLAVALLVFGTGFLIFGDHVRHNVSVLTGASAQAAADGPRRPGPLPDLGPPAAGPITHVELRPIEGCRPEATCSAVVQLTVAAQNTPLEIAWGFELIDRCDGRRESRPGGVLSVPPGQDRAVQTVSVPLPAGRALALVPVTQTPVRVAGVAMPLSARDATC